MAREAAQQSAGRPTVASGSPLRPLDPLREAPIAAPSPETQMEMAGEAEVAAFLEREDRQSPLDDAVKKEGALRRLLSKGGQLPRLGLTLLSVLLSLGALQVAYAATATASTTTRAAPLPAAPCSPSPAPPAGTADVQASGGGHLGFAGVGRASCFAAGGGGSRGGGGCNTGLFPQVTESPTHLCTEAL